MNTYYLTADIVNHLTDAALPFSAAEFRREHPDREVPVSTAQTWFTNKFIADYHNTMYNAMARAVTAYTRQPELNGTTTEYSCMRG